MGLLRFSVSYEKPSVGVIVIVRQNNFVTPFLFVEVKIVCHPNSRSLLGEALCVYSLRKFQVAMHDECYVRFHGERKHHLDECLCLLHHKAARRL